LTCAGAGTGKFILVEETIMKIFVLTLLLFIPMTASAEYLDAIESKMVDGCSSDKYLEIVKDFNKEWGMKNGYSAKIAMPLQSGDLESFFWLGTTKDAASFGKAWDAWRDAMSDSNSVAAKLQARLDQCSLNVARRGYDLY
jgi:hypothetical protein